MSNKNKNIKIIFQKLKTHYVKLQKDLHKELNEGLPTV